MVRREHPDTARSSYTDIHMRLMSMRNAVVQKREDQSKPGDAPGKINRQAVILNMATRLGTSVYRNLPQEKQQQTGLGKIRALAVELLKDGMEVDAVAEKLHEMFIGP